MARSLRVLYRYVNPRQVSAIANLQKYALRKRQLLPALRQAQDERQHGTLCLCGFFFALRCEKEPTEGDKSFVRRLRHSGVDAV